MNKHLLLAMVTVIGVTLPVYGSIGVFPVLKQSKIPGHKPQVAGTAFLIDATEGLFLTAAHVLKSAYVYDPNKDKVSIKCKKKFASGLVLDENLKLRVVHCGCDPSKLNSYTGSCKDWAVLQLDDESKKYLLNNFHEIEIDLNVKAEFIIDKHKGPCFVYGYPGLSEVLVPKAVTLYLKPTEKGLWPADAKGVEIGSSGGPCVWGQDITPTLLGIVVKKEPCRFVPSYSFIEELAKKGPKSTDVNNIIKLLQLSPNEPKEPNEAQLIKLITELETTLSGLNGLEYRQIMEFMFELSRQKALLDAVLHAFLYLENVWGWDWTRIFASRNRQLFDELLLACNKRLEDSLSSADPDSVKARHTKIAIKFGRYISENYMLLSPESIPDLPDLLSKTLAAYAKLDTERIGAHTPGERAGFFWAAERLRDKNPPNLDPVVVTVKPDPMLEHYRAVLKRIEVEQKKTVAEQDYTDIRKELTVIANKTEAGRIAGLAKMAIDHVEGLELPVLALEQVRLQNEQLSKRKPGVRSIFVTIPVDANDIGKFAFTGQFQFSTQYGIGQYFILDDSGNILFQAVPSDQMKKVALNNFFGKKVGLTGTILALPPTEEYAMVKFSEIAELK